MSDVTSRGGQYRKDWDEPADPFDSPPPPEAIERLRGMFPPETVAAFERHLREFGAAKHDWDALLARESWRALSFATLTLVANDPVKAAAVLTQAIGRARYGADPDGFGDWLAG